MSEDGESKWFSIVKSTMKLPLVKVDRRSFLEKNFREKCSSQQLMDALENGTGIARISLQDMDKVADSVIKNHTIAVTTASAAAGIPGFIAMIGTVPADIIQFHFHVFQVAQKLAYVYGYPDFDSEENNEEFTYLITLFVGVMFGVQSANVAIKQISKKFTEQIIKRVPRMALSKTAIYPIVKQIAKWLGITITKQSTAKGISKAIPLISTLISGGITLATFHPMCKKLKNELRENVIRKELNN